MSASLRALAEKVERAQRPAPFLVRLYTSDLVVVGRPAPAAMFAAQMRDAVLGEAREVVRQQVARKERDAVFSNQVQPEIQQWLGELEAGDAGGDELTLLAARLMPSAGDAIGLPAVRVPIAAVSAWWLAGGRDIKQASGTTWFVGASVPIGS